MRHLKQIDGDAHTVLLIQVENESGNIGSVRDNSPEANREFAGPVPADLLAAAHKQPGTWKQVFDADADEIFQAYYQAKYINEIAAAGKQEFDIPCYINVWIDYPSAELPQRQLDTPGIGYPSGGAVQKLIGLWRALAPSIDMIGPDIYTDDSPLLPRDAWRRIVGPTTHSGFLRRDATTALPSSFSTRLEKARLDFLLSAWIKRDGTFSATTLGRVTAPTLL